MTDTALLKTGLQRIRSHFPLTRLAVMEAYRERIGGHEALPAHGPHVEEALDWLLRAQEANADGGFSRAYGLTWNPYFNARGWQPSYPETTGYIIPTLYHLARVLHRPELALRADRAALWEIDIQLPSGAVRGGVMGERPSPAVFNTGQVLFGWLAALQETGAGVFAEAARRAGSFLVAVQDGDGLWRRGNSAFADPRATLYNARTAWALAEAGVRLEEPAFTDAAARNLRAVARLPHANGWIPDCCLTDRQRPLLHTLAYAIQGLLEGGRVLEDGSLIERAAHAAEQIAARVEPDGKLPGRMTSDWGPAASWSCLTGEAQMINVWIRLYEITGDGGWMRPVPAVLRFLKSTQNRTSSDPGLRGGIKGSYPVDGEYGRFEVLNWATKFFIDALARDERAASGIPTPFDDPLLLA
ncbi:MAG: hypothetical protein HY700_16025 [Gemmatimonadetes bacterium]|nr:hypothetical protein [Gemmatimonadota bacterium]